jgi:penicillin-binding protein 1A
MMVLLRAVTAHGTGAAVAQMKHPLGGKTGTTSDYTDAWFLGFSPSITCGVWVGFDSRESLGDKETGAKAALPIWMTVMKTAIAGKDSEQFLADQGSDSKQGQKPGAAPPEKQPAKPLLQAAARGASQSAAKPVVASPSAAPATAKAPVPAAKVPAKVAPASPSSVDPRVRPALPPQAAPPRPAATVKPALQN